MKLARKVLLLTAFVIAGGLVSVWYYVSGTPQYTLYKLSKAIRAHDVEGAERYVDIDRVADDATQTIVTAGFSQQRSAEASSALERLGQSVAKGTIRFMLSALKADVREEWRREFIKMVEGGQEVDLTILPPLDAMEAYKVFKVTRDQKVAYVNYTDPKQGLIKFKMVQRSDRRWKIVSFDSDWLLIWLQDSPVRNIKAGNINEIKAGTWVVMVGCAGFAQGSDPCKTEEQYRWLKSLRDRHPKFIAYSETWTSEDLGKVRNLAEIRKVKFGLIFRQVVEQLRADVFLRSAGAFAGPFESRPQAETWARWANSLGSSPDGYDFRVWEIVNYIRHIEPEERLLSASKTGQGVVTEASYGSGGGGFTVKTDEGADLSFFYYRASNLPEESQSTITSWPSPGDKGRRYSVRYKEVAYKRGGKVVQKSLELLDIRRLD